MDDFVCEPYRVDEIYSNLAKHLGLKYFYRSSEAEAVVASSADTVEASDEPWPAI